MNGSECGFRHYSTALQQKRFSQRNWLSPDNFKWPIFSLYLLSFKHVTSAVSRAILKPLYRIGIPNSNSETLKSVDFWCKLSSMFLVAESRERCSELFRTQNSEKFPEFRPWTPLGRAYSAAPDSPTAQWFFSSLRSSKNLHPQKIAGYGTGYIMGQGGEFTVKNATYI